MRSSATLRKLIIDWPTPEITDFEEADKQVEVMVKALEQNHTLVEVELEVRHKKRVKKEASQGSGAAAAGLSGGQGLQLQSPKGVRGCSCRTARGHGLQL